MSRPGAARLTLDQRVTSLVDTSITPGSRSGLFASAVSRRSSLLNRSRAAPNRTSVPSSRYIVETRPVGGHLDQGDLTADRRREVLGELGRRRVPLRGELPGLEVDRIGTAEQDVRDRIPVEDGEHPAVSIEHAVPLIGALIRGHRRTFADLDGRGVRERDPDASLVDPRDRLQLLLRGLGVGQQRGGAHEIVDHRVDTIGVGVPDTDHRDVLRLDREQAGTEHGQHTHGDEHDQRAEQQPAQPFPAERTLDRRPPFAQPRLDAPADLAVDLGGDRVAGVVVVDEDDVPCAGSLEITLDVHGVREILVIGDGDHARLADVVDLAAAPVGGPDGGGCRALLGFRGLVGPRSVDDHAAAAVVDPDHGRRRRGRRRRVDERVLFDDEDLLGLAIVVLGGEILDVVVDSQGAEHLVPARLGIGLRRPISGRLVGVGRRIVERPLQLVECGRVGLMVVRIRHRARTFRRTRAGRCRRTRRVALRCAVGSRSPAPPRHGRAR